MDCHADARNDLSLLNNISKTLFGFYKCFAKFFTEISYINIDASGKHMIVKISPNFFEKRFSIYRNSSVLKQIFE